MTKNHFVGKVSLRAIIIRDEKALIARDINDPDIWEIPGGRLDEEEGLEACLKRELVEELGVHIAVGPLIYAEQFHQTRDGVLSLLIAYEATLVDPDAPFKLAPDEVAEVKWVGKDELQHQKIYDNCLHALKAYWKL